MSGLEAVSPAGVADILAGERGRERADRPARPASDDAALVAGLLKRRQLFGITRVGSITRLDRTSVPVVQTVRPYALSGAVASGKGLDPMQAAASALMETLEIWAGENIDAGRISVAVARDMAPAVRRLYAAALVHRFDAGWDQLALRWIDGWDLFTGQVIAVPLALVDTVYTYPSPHPVAFPRSTAGLAGGRTLQAAIVHAGLELLERDSRAAAARHRTFFDDCQLDGAAIKWPVASRLIGGLRRAGMEIGIWLIRSDHGLPVYWCHVMEGDGTAELAPLPGEGFGCDFTHDAALTRALLEACQSRAVAIAGAREDITRRAYPDRHERDVLAAWRDRIARPPGVIAVPADAGPPRDGAAALAGVLGALRKAGAGAAIVVPLLRLADPAIHIVRLVAPPLRHGERG